MASIKANLALEAQEASSFIERQTAEQDQARLRREEARQEYEKERREMMAGREDVLSRLAAGRPGDAAAIVAARESAGQKKVLLKKSSARRSEEDRIRLKQAALRGSEGRRTGGATPATPGGITTTATAGAAAAGGGGAGDSLLIKGLKKIEEPEPEKPYDPFGGMLPGKRDYYTFLDSYPSTYLDPIREDTRMQAGGYDLREYYSRSLLEAFAGLGCFVDEEEVARREEEEQARTTSRSGAAAAVSTATTAASMAAVRPGPPETVA